MSKKFFRTGTATMKQAFFLKQIGTGLYVHPAGKHLFDNSLYGLKPEKIGAIVVFDEQVDAFMKMFFESDILLEREELKPENLRP